MNRIHTNEVLARPPHVIQFNRADTRGRRFRDSLIFLPSVPLSILAAASVHHLICCAGTADSAV